MKTILSLVGARPQFIKLAALSPVLRREFKEIIVHTGQHYDYKMSGLFFQELHIPEPDFNLEVGSASAISQIARMLVSLEEVVSRVRPDCMVVFGDTNSTLAGALVATKLGIPLAHVEAGLRAFDKTIPEETNRLVTDVLSDYFFCPTASAVELLRKEGVTKNVYNVGDVMIDLNVRFEAEIKDNRSALDRFGVRPNEYYFATCHRASNTEDTGRLIQIINALVALDKPVIFPVHPRTRKALEALGMEYLLNSGSVLVSDPLPYIATQSLIFHAAGVLTDSGGITKEAYYYRKHGVVFDTKVEWVETVQEGWNQLTGADTAAILKAVREWQEPSFHSQCVGKGQASEAIVGILKSAL